LCSELGDKRRALTFLAFSLELDPEDEHVRDLWHEAASRPARTVDALPERRVTETGEGPPPDLGGRPALRALLSQRPSRSSFIVASGAAVGIVLSVLVWVFL
jgi:hypothetical protein